MSLIDEVKTICDRLAPLGWRDLLLDITGGGLDIFQPITDKLKATLTKPLATIDRTQKGFEDFHPTATQAITGGRPAHSLLYHALASLQVHPTVTGMPSQNLAHYPSFEELDTIENYIYSLAADQVDLTDTVIAVFAYQYREASRTSHLRHADFAYSRTGVARCLVPRCTGVIYDQLRREELWDRYCTEAPGRQRRCVERYSIVKRA